MFPLLVRDGLRVPYYILTFLYWPAVLSGLGTINRSAGTGTGTSQSSDVHSVPSVHTATRDKGKGKGMILFGYTIYNTAYFWCVISILKYIFISLSSLGIVVLHICEVYIQPPTRYPDLYPALYSLYGVCNLLVVYLVTIFMLDYILSNDNNDNSIAYDSVYGEKRSKNE